MIKIAIVGAGLWGHKHAQLYGERASVEVVAVCDVNE